MEFLAVAAFAILNRARGSKLFDTTDSTVLARLVSTLGMALIVGFSSLSGGDYMLMGGIVLWTWASLMLWCTPAWDALWGATIGHDPAHSRLWGLAHLSLRMTLAAPCIIGLALFAGHWQGIWWALATPLLALPYYISGYVTPGTHVIRNAELGAGALLGFLIMQAV